MKILIDIEWNKCPCSMWFPFCPPKFPPTSPWYQQVLSSLTTNECEDQRLFTFMCLPCAKMNDESYECCREYIKPKFPTVSLNVWIQIFSFCSGAHKMYVRYSKVMETTHMVEWCLGTPHSLNLGTYLHVALNQAATSCIALVIYTHERT